MKNLSKTKQALIQELAALKRRMAELEQLDVVRKQVEESLRREKQFTESIIQTAQVIVMILDTTGSIVSFNPYMQEISGYPLQEVQGKDWFSMFLPERDQDQMRDLFFKAVSDIQTRGNVNPIVTKDGRELQIEWYDKTLRDGAGNVVGLVSVGHDITERKRAEEALLIIKKAIESTSDAIGISDPQGHHFYQNESFTNLFEYTAEELEATGGGYVVFSSSDTAHEVFDAIVNGESWVGETEMISKSGRRFPVYLRADAIKDDAGRIISVVGTFTDTTERKRAEEALRQAKENFRLSFENSPLGIRIVTMGGETIYANRAILDLYGFDSMEELKSTSVTKRYTPESFAAYQIRKEKRIRGDDSPPEYEVDIVRKNGDVRHLHVIRKEILWDGEMQFQVIYQDITDRKRAEEELRASHQQLRALARRQQQMREEARVAMSREIHDELGGGLTGLKMDLLWLLNKSYETEKGGKDQLLLMNKIKMSSELIDHMIQVVRRVATELRPSVLDDLGLIAALEWQLQEFTRRTNITHEFVTKFNDVTLEEATAVAVFRIFQEAMINVAQHSGATKVAVAFREDETLFGDKAFILEIMDNGRGITEEELRSLRSLGILGMKERSLVIGGGLRIAGNPGEGTTVILRIPQKQGEPS